MAGVVQASDRQAPLFAEENRASIVRVVSSASSIGQLPTFSPSSKLEKRSICNSYWLTGWKSTREFGIAPTVSASPISIAQAVGRAWAYGKLKRSQPLLPSTESCWCVPHPDEPDWVPTVKAA